ncbi:hypothetical protein [Bradyrhizobium sp. LHD-71]|uniref:hypothetical protein n=1 Tax=Bradyrhizobium sp. LHD-71 TaxID=3072141 RepID=UPI0028106464|nr:hypothetical protein [Bradyrhizobium sp. LHD-71]MDQ8729438.1 hypothetical protein [Bradyrhizobium sp. LHD-71]
MKAKRRKPSAPFAPASVAVHGRRAARMRLQADTAEIEVDDPHAARAGEKITVLRQLRSDPLARLHSHRQIDEAQYRAGRAFQRDWEVAERGVHAIDLTRERVDGGQTPEPLSERQARARKRLIERERVLGRTMHRVIHAVLVDGLSMELLAQRLFNREGEVAAKYYGRLFRDALDVLAVEYGLAGRA